MLSPGTPSARSKQLGFASLWLLIALLPGCASFTRIDMAPEVLAAASVEAFPGLRFAADRPPPFAGATNSSVNGDYTVLALSGGGADGAFGVGLLNGLTAAGRRPEFDVVTGVSTGALMAPFAFLGPSQDARLKDLYTGPHLAKLLRQGSVLRLLRGPSIYRNKQLKAEIAKNVTADLLAAIATEHQRGRRLYVATANLDAQRMVIWDMGAIAAIGTEGSHALFEQILLAATSIPLAFDPVMIAENPEAQAMAEAHSDATSFAHVYAAEALFPVDDCRAKRRTCAIYIIAHSKLAAEPRTLKMKAGTVGSRALQTLLKSSLRTRLSVAEQLANGNAIAFNLAFLDVPFPSASPLEFDSNYMQRLYEIGYAQGLREGSWSASVPPDRPT